MARQLLSALSVAHAAGVMHRDVKPSNVLLGSDDRAVLTDFGIATFQGDPKLTQTGMVMGSPGFTAPERIRGEDASPASDLWSLGATVLRGGRGPRPVREARRRDHHHVRHHQRGRARGAHGGRARPGHRRAAPPRARRPAGRERGRADDHRRAAAAAGPDSGHVGRLRAHRALRVVPADPAGAGPRPARGRYRQAGRAPPGRRFSRARPRWISPRPSTTMTPRDRRAHRAAQHGIQASAAQTAPTAPQPVQGGSRPGRRARRTISPPGTTPRPGRGSRQRPVPVGRPAARPATVRGQSDTIRHPGRAPRRRHRARQQAPGPQQAPGSAPWSGAGYAPPRRRRSGLGWKAAVAVLAIIGAGAGAATVVLLHQDHTGSPQGQTGATGSASGALPSAANAPQIVNAINRGPPGRCPAGSHTIASRPRPTRPRASASPRRPAGRSRRAATRRT